MFQFGYTATLRLVCEMCSRAYPIDDYPARTRQAAAIMHMLMNNLDPQVAQFPQELVTYGGNGQVLGNWAQVSVVTMRTHCPINTDTTHIGSSCACNIGQNCFE